jgi:hypothetical protein
MSHPLHHALSSAKSHGGKWEDYIDLHNWFDETKSALADVRHRAMRHHSEGIFWAEQIFGVHITNSDGKMVPTRVLGEQHVKEDIGWIPTMKDWLTHLSVQSWMMKPGEGRKFLSEMKDEKLDYIKT